MPAKHHDTTLYYLMAHAAARLERERDLRRGAKIWLKARQVSRNRFNQAWCENRADFCRKLLLRTQRISRDGT